MNRLFGCFFLLVLHSLFLVPPALASDCLKYKTSPSLEIKEPGFSISVVRPNRPMNLLHGNVVATFSEEYEIEYGAQKHDGGWCVFIERIAVEMGYADFVVQVDWRHHPESCEFKNILEHEDEHIAAHLAVMRDERANIRNAIASAANNVLPVFANGADGIDHAMNELESELQNRPEINLLRQKLSAEREIRNKKIDLNDKGGRIKKCL